EASMIRRLAIMAVIAISCFLAATVLWRAREDYMARRRVRIARTTIKAGMTPAVVRELLGPPAFNEPTITNTFAPSSIDCMNRSVSAFVYQSSSAQSLVVFFDTHQHVVCVEQMMAFRIITP